ncbi:single-strand DNA-binding protein [Mycolicibacterium mucogenicum 261Sha1.1M5]|uniref:single-stranded DNA-binding protein n=1 Tax=Leucobacter aridicollis TaxID=283878 RepID=UPI000F210440|nr:single-stranded DNA-binding protein [Leucobacter aridicollis]MCS3428573.1 single-strand DNA-binding protein [Leucobacter aridicollis]RKQ84066.1 single-strand DNA-binding protein [Mycolicibacterium mucogenicum 261Sha1.1M5]
MAQHISVIGQIATEPKLFTPAGGAEFCTFRLASSDRRFDAETKEWSDGDTNWFTINTFRGLARHAKQSFKKGDRIVVAGRLRLRDWENEGKRGTAVEVDAEGVGHDVRFGVSGFLKASAVDGGGAAAEPSPSDGATHVGVAAPPEPKAVGATSGATSADGFTPELASA